MRQGNGADLLGANDPRSATIGMIYVAPNDDRESVLAAILTQEKLGRKQIAIVLPDQNKAFQRPVDFDGLKNMRRKLQAQLVIVAPGGPGPAEFARQRRFPVYSSSESYARSLHDEGQPPPPEAKRGLFGRKTKLQPADAADNNGSERNGQMPPPPVPVPLPGPTPPSTVPPSPSPNTYQGTEDEDEQDDFNEQQQPHQNGNGAMPGAAGTGLAAGAAADFAANGAIHDDDDTPTLMNDDNDWDELPPVSPAPAPIMMFPSASPAGSGPTIVDSTAASEPDAMAPPSAIPPDEHEDDGFVPPPPSPVPVPAPEPDIIQFPQPRSRSTNKLPVAANLDDNTLGAGPVAPIPLNVPQRQRVSNAAGAGAVATGAAVGAGAAGLAAAGTGAAATGRNVGAGGTPPTRGNAGGGGGAGGPGGPPRRRRRGGWLIALIALLLLSLLLLGGIALAAPQSPLGSAVRNVVGGNTPGATVTITPKSQDLKSNFAILAVTGTPDKTQRQVQARQLSYTTPVQSKTVNATGVGHIPAKQATGSLTFYNALTNAQTVGAGTVFSVGGVQIVNNGPAAIPAAVPPTEGSITVSAHAVTAGSAGNIRAYAINGSCCVTGVTVQNTSAFTGGQDEQNYTIVQQSDVDNVANPLVSPAEKSALSTVQGQKHSNEQFVAQPQCSPKVTANPPVGTKSNTVTVSVSATCNGEVYDQSGAIALAVTSLTNQASKDPGPHYVLVGSINAAVTQANIVDSKGTISLVVAAEGIWVYNFTNAQKTQLAQQIAGKSKADATAILAAQEGVSKIDSISITSGGDTLPTDPTQISIVITSVPGLSGTPTATGSPTTTPPTTAPGSPQPGAGFGTGSGNS